MKRILVIDDLRVFDPLPDEEIVTKRTLPTIGVFMDASWDEVWLDHDLGGESTIRPLVSQIEEMGHEGTFVDVGMFVVITDNSPARDWMIAALKPYYPVEVGKREYRIDWNDTSLKAHQIRFSLP